MRHVHNIIQSRRVEETKQSDIMKYNITLYDRRRHVTGPLLIINVKLCDLNANRKLQNMYS